MAKYAKKVKILGLTKETGYMYFVDKDGDISMTPLRYWRKALEKKGIKPFEDLEIPDELPELK